MRILRSRHTLELSAIQDDPNFDLFDMDYDFYDPMLKKQFEIKFYDYYRYKEIGFESIERFQRQLMSKLNMIMPYYKQLYITELKSKDIDYLLNKDLRETTEREITTDSESLMKSIAENVFNNMNKTSGNNTHKESVLNNINANIGEDKLTGMSLDNSDESLSMTGNENNNSSSKSNINSIVKDRNTLISRGNIGITSSAELLEKWREVLINIDEMIIVNELWDLFSLL